MSLGAKIKQLREERNMTQGDLSRVAELTRSYVSLLEINKIANPGSQAIVKLAKALGVSEDVLLDAAGIKRSQPPAVDPLVELLKDPELSEWITVENIGRVPYHTKRAIAAIIRDALAEPYRDLEELGRIGKQLSERASPASRGETTEAVTPAGVAEKNRPEELPRIKFRVDTMPEIEDRLKRLKEKTYRIAGGVQLQLKQQTIAAFWPEVRVGRPAILELEDFYRKEGSGELWDSSLLVNWSYNLPSQPIPAVNPLPHEQSILRLDLKITRGDGKQVAISFWFEGPVYFELLKTVYFSNRLWLMAERFERRGGYRPGMPLMEFEAVALEELGLYLAALARLNNLDAPELLATFPEEALPVTGEIKEGEVAGFSYSSSR
jgi:transcriptional regulator with XRE-family HTH domain